MQLLINIHKLIVNSAPRKLSFYEITAWRNMVTTQMGIQSKDSLYKLYKSFRCKCPLESFTFI